jgi:hypothetical protein
VKQEKYIYLLKQQETTQTVIQPIRLPQSAFPRTMQEVMRILIYLYQTIISFGQVKDSIEIGTFKG